jgi:Zn finger protein HypA/HybF involved in hydrogenase expression
MHEAGIADRILEIVIARASAAGAPRITAIHVEAGALAGVSEDSLRFHWEQHAAGTQAEGAVLHFTEIDEPTDLRLVAIDVEGDDGDEGVGGADGDPGED